MFNKQDLSNTKEIETIVGPSVKIKGDFHGSGNIVIEGSVEGNLKSDKFISIKDKALVIADVEAHDALIGGEVHGNITIKGFLEILSSAKISGDIQANSLSISQGAIFNGNCAMAADHNPADPAQKNPKPAEHASQ